MEFRRNADGRAVLRSRVLDQWTILKRRALAAGLKPANHKRVQALFSSL
jgi:hypothetical protein